LKAAVPRTVLKEIHFVLLFVAKRMMLVIVLKTFDLYFYPLNSYPLKKVAFLPVIVTLIACSSTRFMNSWENKEIGVFSHQKLLVTGRIDNLTSRKIFERALKELFIKHGINVNESRVAIKQSLTP
jgi:hypothetical protein